MQANDVRDLARQIDAVGDFSKSMIGDMAVDRGEPEDVAYRAMVECFPNPMQRHAELVRFINDDSPVAQRMLRRLSPDYPTRSSVFMAMYDMVNRRLQSLTDNIAAHPDDAARHLLNLERRFLNLSNLMGEVMGAQSPCRSASAPPTRQVEQMDSDTALCSICFESVTGDSTACSGCNNCVHTTCLDAYRRSVGGVVPCPTCRRTLP